MGYFQGQDEGYYEGYCHAEAVGSGPYCLTDSG